MFFLAFYLFIFIFYFFFILFLFFLFIFLLVLFFLFIYYLFSTYCKPIATAAVNSTLIPRQSCTINSLQKVRNHDVTKHFYSQVFTISMQPM